MPTIKEVVDNLIGNVVREGGRFRFSESYPGIPPVHPKIKVEYEEMFDRTKKHHEEEKKIREEMKSTHPELALLIEWFDADEDYVELNPEVAERLGVEAKYDFDASKQRVLAHLQETGIVVKALVKVSGSDPTTADYLRVDEDFGLYSEDSGKYAGYELVLWEELRMLYPQKTLEELKAERIRPPIIRYIKPEKVECERQVC